MRLNLWQWIGLVLLVAGVILVYSRYTGDQAPSSKPAATQPSK